VSFAFAIAAVLLAAVGVAASYGAKRATTTLTMWSYDNQDPGLEPVLKQLSKQFEASHPGVKINLVFKDFNSLVGTVPRALASGSGPDVTEGNQGYQTDAQLVKAKLILPLDKYIQKYHWDKLYSASTWGMFRWTPDGKSFGKGPIWGLAQTGQNIVVFYNKAKLRSLGVTKLPTTFAAFDKLLGQARAKLPKSDPVIEEGNKEGYGFIHLFGGIWGAYEQPAKVRNWIYHVAGSRYDTPGTIKALTKLQQWAKAGYFNSDYNERSVRVDRRSLRSLAHLVEDEVRGPGRGMAQLRDHLDAGEEADVRSAAAARRLERQGAHE
jgi:raffinose/stachyose/melibiose transport system substrate-binding protein